jgi:hypothetical protein
MQWKLWLLGTFKVKQRLLLLWVCHCKNIGWYGKDNLYQNERRMEPQQLPIVSKVAVQVLLAINTRIACSTSVLNGVGTAAVALIMCKPF